MGRNIGPEMAQWVTMFGATGLQSKDNNLNASVLSDADCVGVYFSAHWCPPCRGFTPQLASIYQSLKSAGKKFEVVFVSSDQDQAGFDDYFSQMPWLALPYNQRERKNNLSSQHGVSGIPSLVLLDKQGNVITTNGRSVVLSDPSGSWIGSAAADQEPTAVPFESSPESFAFTDGDGDRVTIGRDNQVRVAGHGNVGKFNGIFGGRRYRAGGGSGVIPDDDTLVALQAWLGAAPVVDPANCKGFFTNVGDFFGPGRKEYIHISVVDGTRWQALKVVGDENVPRGLVTMRTLPGHTNATALNPAEIQIRRDTSDPDGFEWMGGCTAQYSQATDSWCISITDYGLSVDFKRVSEDEAANAAATNPDYSDSVSPVRLMLALNNDLARITDESADPDAVNVDFTIQG